MPKGTNLTIQDVIKSISEGDYRIPRFQRDFVWSIKDSANLIDSILKGYPIGSVILWKTKQELSEIRDFGGLSIPDKDTGRYTSYVIDGQQRLTSLLFALKGLKTSDTDYSNICVSLIANNEEQIVFDTLPEDSSPDDFVALKDLYSAVALGGTHSDKRLEYYQTLLQYNVSVIEIDDEKLDLNDVIDIFERLNLGGKRLSLLSIISARSYQSPGIDDEGNEIIGFDLSKEFDDFNDGLKSNNYGKISDSTFLQSIAACIIEKVNRAEILKNLDAEEIRNKYQSIKTAILAAIEHLKGNSYGVRVFSLLPYEPILVSFAYFHYKIGNSQIAPIQESYLIDYFWRCVLGKRYNKSTDTNLNNDILKIKKIVNSETPNQEQIVLSPKALFENGKYKISSAFTKGMLCLMAQESPQSFAIGRTINITNDAVSNKADRQLHHFFPQKCSAILSNDDYKKDVDNVINIVFMDALTNNQIDNRNPSVYIPEYSERTPEENPLPNAEIIPAFGDILSTHYISLEGFGIENDNYHLFINSRSRAFYNKLNNLIIPTADDTIEETIVFVIDTTSNDTMEETTEVENN